MSEQQQQQQQQAAQGGDQSAATNLLEAAAAAAAAGKGDGKGGEPAKPAVAFTFDEKGIETTFGKVGEDGRPSNVPAKYWDADRKAVKADVVLSQLRWAEGKLGKKLEVIGAPEKDYEIKLAEGLDLELDGEDPAVKGFLSVAKKHDVSQAFVSEVLNEVAKLVGEVRPLNVQAEIAKLGDRGVERLKNIADFLGAHVTKEQAQTLQATLTSAAAVEALEAVIKSAAPPAFMQKGEVAAQGSGKMTVDQWNALNFAVDEFGNRKRSVDPVYNKMVEDLRDEVFGTTRRDPSGRPLNGGV